MRIKGLENSRWKRFYLFFGTLLDYTKHLIAFVDEVLKLEFFKGKASFSKAQLRKSEDQTCVLQTLMLTTGYKFAKFGNDDVLKFVQSYRKTYKEEELELCKNLFVKLNKVFKEKNKLIKKINIPMFAMTLKTSEDSQISFNKFTEWANYIIRNYNTNWKYASYCNRNTTNKEKVNKRLELMCESLIKYETKGDLN